MVPPRDIPLFDRTPFGERLLDEEDVPGPHYEVWEYEELNFDED